MTDREAAIHGVGSGTATDQAEWPGEEYNIREDSREDWAPSRNPAAQGRAAGRGLVGEGSCRSKEGVGCGSCSTRNFIKAETQAQGARHHFGIKRITYQ